MRKHTLSRAHSNAHYHACFQKLLGDAIQLSQRWIIAPLGLLIRSIFCFATTFKSTMVCPPRAYECANTETAKHNLIQHTHSHATARSAALSAQWRSVHRGVSQAALASIEGQAVFADGAMGSVALAVDGATRMRLAELATLVTHAVAGSSRICTSVAGFALRIGGCLAACLGSLAHLLRLACCALHVPLRISMGER